MTLFAGETEVYAMAEFKVLPEEIPALAAVGLPLDCSFHSWDERYHTFIVPVTAYDIKLLHQNRISFKIVVENAAEFYEKRALADKDNAEKVAREYQQRTEMKLGTFGGAYSPQEIMDTLDSLYAKYGKEKNLITQKQSIGKSVEGKDIYFVKISDNASADEGEKEPRALYTGLIHAREPGGMMAIFYFMYYLLENYEKDARVKNIVDNRELYFILNANPDGYMSNYKTNPNGGGMNRKNKNSVDLNRNFGPKDYWDYPNNGSSTSPSSQTYRGTAPFSEAETKALSNFVAGKKFRTTLNYHTYSNLLIYPWGIKDQVAHDMFKTMATEMTKINKYRAGTAPGLLYPVRGVSDDWFYKAEGVFAMTPEVGGYSDGFWPSPSRYFPLAQENLEANLLLAEYAGQVPFSK